jgi:hypothetical protein
MSMIPDFLDNPLTDGVEVVNRTRRRRSTFKKHYLVPISAKGWVNPQGHNTAGRIREIEKHSMTSSGLEPAALRL